MDKLPPNRRAPITDAPTNLRRTGATVIAAALGAVAGGIAAATLPAEKFAWTGFALVPAFVLLEVLLKHFVALFKGDLNAARIMLASALVAGFYAAWFAARSL